MELLPAVGGDAGGVSFQVWMHTVNSISKKERALCRTGIDTYFTLSQLLQCYSFHLNYAMKEGATLKIFQCCWWKRALIKNRAGKEPVSLAAFSEPWLRRNLSLVSGCAAWGLLWLSLSSGVPDCQSLCTTAKRGGGRISPGCFHTSWSLLSNFPVSGRLRQKRDKEAPGRFGMEILIILFTSVQHDWSCSLYIDLYTKWSHCASLDSCPEPEFHSAVCLLSSVVVPWTLS